MRTIKTCFFGLVLGAVMFAQAPAAAPAAKPKPAAAKPAAGRVPASYKDLKFPALNEGKQPEPARFEMPNGIVVYLLEDRELPMINVTARIRTGSRWEPVSKTGLAEIAGQVMRTGGTAKRNGDKLDEELDRLGASVETGIGAESGGASVSVLKEDIDKGLDILADLLQNPSFPEDKIGLAKIQLREEVARRNDNPQQIADREFTRLIYGKDSPYGAQAEYETINAVTRADLVQFHQRFFQPENVIVAAWGDFSAQEMRARLERTLGAWKRGGKPRPEIPPVSAAAANRAGVYLIDKDDVNQSNIVMGYLGGKRNDPDFFPLTVMNTILGGGFASRTFNNIRSQEGLSYYAYTNWAAGWDHPGLFLAAGATKSENTVKIINAFKKEFEKITAAEVTDDELARAKEAVMKGFAFEFDSTAKIISRILAYEYYGYPKDFLQQYRKGIESVTKADILRVAKAHIDNNRLAIVVLGKEKDFVTPLSTLGTVAKLDITIPAPKQTALAAATPESIAKGRALLKTMRAALGGDAIAKVKDYRSSGTMVVIMGSQEIALKAESTTSLAGKSVVKLQTPMGEMTQGFDGETVWIKQPQGIRAMPPAAAVEARGEFFRELISLAQNSENPAYTVQALDPEKVDGKDAAVVAVTNADQKSLRLYLDATGLPLKKTYMGSGMTGGPPAETDELYSDWREVEGVKWAFKTVMQQAGKKSGEVTLTELKLNPGLEDAAYKKPEK